MSSSSDESIIFLLNGLMHQENKKKKKQKTAHQRAKQREKNEQKRLLNNDLSILPPFQTLKPYQVTFINYMSAFFVILRLTERAAKTTVFSIDTETDDTSKMPALIQIQFLQFDDEKEDEEVTIVIFEMCQLPHVSSIIYPQIQKLVNTIFHSSKTFLSWDDEKPKLNQFTKYNLFTSSVIQDLNIINVQSKFKDWYNKRFKHNQNCPMALSNNINDDPSCLCRHRPYEKPNDKWSLQLAIYHTFNQFLDKSSTINAWGQGLDLRLYQNLRWDVLNYNVKSTLTDKEDQIRLKLIKYAADDCLAVTVLWITIQQ